MYRRSSYRWIARASEAFDVGEGIGSRERALLLQKVINARMICNKMGIFTAPNEQKQGFNIFVLGLYLIEKCMQLSLAKLTAGKRVGGNFYSSS